MNTRPLQDIGATADVNESTPHVTRREHLRRELRSTIQALHRHRADLVPGGFVEDYVALRWLEWKDGVLRLTAMGKSICEQIRVRLK
jgi:hypothetical protein